MVNYRRNFVPGGTYFFTLTLADRKSSLLTENIHQVKESVQQVKQKFPFKMNAYVILPEHLHMIWTLPQNDAGYSVRWQKIKAGFTKAIRKSGLELRKTRHGEYCVWQRRFWEHTIRDSQDFENHLNYIHYNPIKHGLVVDLCDWPHSSFHYYVRKQLLPEGWASVGRRCEVGRSYGE